MSQPAEGASVAPNPVEYVRSRPELYFQGPIDSSWLVGLVVSGALAHGAADFHVEEREGWWALQSSRDWLGKDAMDAFFTLKPDPVVGPNTHRMEILLVAFAEDVWTATPGDPVAISRVGPMPAPVRIWLDSAPQGRLIAFRRPKASRSAPDRHLAVVPYDEALRNLAPKLSAYP